ncbi:MAG: BON domain-containing protein [Thermoguttaceae bacterium]|nr:BON domain-containing protein [Thermoguttaceae bacterium]
MRRLFVPICFGLLIALGVPSVQAGNQEEANKIAQRLTQQYPQYNIEVAYQEGTVRLRGDVATEADRDEIANFVRHIPKVRSVSETMNVTPNAGRPVQQSAIRPVQALQPVEVSPVVYGDEAIPAYVGGAPIGAAIEGSAPIAAPAAAPAAYGTPVGTPIGTPIATGSAGAVRSPSDYFAPQGAATPVAQDGRPNVPNYAWPSYASYPNYSQVAYPKAYEDRAFPYVGPFYPYPEVPLGWRKVTMQWHDGYWWLDFNDGSKNGPFSPLFRQHHQYR